MEGVISLPYYEYDVINKILKYMPKSKGYSIFIPTSRQQRAIDFVILNERNNKILKVQVKGSRSYIHNKSKSFRFSFWFNNFIEKYKENDADIYILYGMYPYFKRGKKVNSKNKMWNSFLLIFNQKEMFKLLSNVKTKKEKKMDKFFGISFNEAEKVFVTRGFEKPCNVSEHLLENYINKIKKMIK